MKSIFALCLLAVSVSLNAQTTEWAFQIGTTTYDRGTGLAVDHNGNVITTGEFAGAADFDPSSSTLNITSNNSSYDAYLAKYDSSGNVLWAFALGGTSDADAGAEVSVDANGDIYLCGKFYQTVDFDPGSGTTSITAPYVSAFLAKYSANGEFQWVVHTTGNSHNHQSYDARVDKSGNVVWTGEFDGTTDFDPGAGTANLTNDTYREFFIAKYTSSGDFLNVGKIGGPTTGSGGVYDMDIDASNNIYLVGYFSGTTDLNPDTASTSIHVANGWDGFVVKMDSNLQLIGDYVYSSAETERVEGIGVDDAGNVLVTGFFSDTLDFDLGSGTTNLVSTTPSGSGSDIFVARYDTAMNLTWAHHFGYNASGSWAQSGQAVRFDPDGDILLAGNVEGSVDFDPSSNSAIVNASGFAEMFIAKYTAAGDFVSVWAEGTFSHSETVNDMEIGVGGRIHTTGQFGGNLDFQMDTGTLNLNSVGQRDAYLMCHFSRCGSVSIEAGADQLQCLNDSTTLTASSGSNYDWSLLGSGTSYTVMPDSTTTYYVTGQAGSGCLATDSVTVTVTSLNPVVTTSDSAICLGDTATISASGGDNYTWDQGLSSVASHMVAPTNNTTYMVIISDTLGCADTLDLTVALFAPTPAEAGPDQIICPGTTTSVMATGGTTYEWDNGLGSGASQDFTTSATTTLYVLVIDSNGCSETDSVTISVHPAAVAMASSDTAICETDSTTISASGGASYAWDQGLGTGQSHLVSPANTTIYTVTVTDTNGCMANDSLSLTVNPNPTPSISGLSQDPYCNNDSAVTLSGAPAGGVFSGAGMSGSMFAPSAAGTGTHTIVYDLTLGTGCSGADTAEAEVVAGLQPIAGFSANVTDSVVTFTNTTTDGLTFLWGFGTGDVSSAISPAYTYPSNGSYEVCLTAYGTCGLSDTLCDSILIMVLGASDPNATSLRQRVWPNPSAGNFQASLETPTTHHVSWQLCDMRGKVIWSAYAVGNTIRFDEPVATGVYFLKAQTTDGSFTQKVVIE